MRQVAKRVAGWCIKTPKRDAYFFTSSIMGVAASTVMLVDTACEGMPTYTHFAQKDRTGLLLSTPAYGVAALTKSVGYGLLLQLLGLHF